MKSELEKLCEAKGVSIEAKSLGETERDGWKCLAWSVTLRYQGRRIVSSFFQGMGHKAPPTAADVLRSLLLDAQSGAEMFDDFCSEFGYSVDSRKALQTYLDCQTNRKQVRLLLGDEWPTFAGAEH